MQLVFVYLPRPCYLGSCTNSGSWWEKRGREWNDPGSQLPMAQRPQSIIFGGIFCLLELSSVKQFSSLCFLKPSTRGHDCPVKEVTLGILGYRKRNLRNLILEVRWKPGIQLHLPAEMWGKRNMRHGIKRPSKMIFLRFCLVPPVSH